MPAFRHRSRSLSNAFAVRARIGTRGRGGPWSEESGAGGKSVEEASLVSSNPSLLTRSP